jgi:hypothetical protein
VLRKICLSTSIFGNFSQSTSFKYRKKKTAFLDAKESYSCHQKATKRFDFPFLEFDGDDFVAHSYAFLLADFEMTSTTMTSSRYE